MKMNKTWKDMVQIGNIKSMYHEKEWKTLNYDEIINDCGLDEGCMQLLFENDNYLIVNYNEYSNELGFINIVDKKSITSQIIEI